MTPQKRAAQYRDVLEVRNGGTELWCVPCGVKVDYKEKCSAERHVESKCHKKMKLENPRVVKEPGASAPLKEEDEDAGVNLG